MRDDLTQPDPPGVKPVRGISLWRWVITSAVIVGLLAAAVFVPLPIVYLYLPGPVRDIEDLVEVEDRKTYSSEGSLFMTTVSVDTTVSFVELLIAAVDGSQAVVMKDDVTGGQSLEELQVEQQREMDSSQANARQVVLSELGFDQPSGEGARVITTFTGAPADGVLEPDDVIVAVDGQPVSTDMRGRCRHRYA